MGEAYGLEYQIAEVIYDWIMGEFSTVLPNIEANFDLLKLDQQTSYFEIADRIIDILEENPEELSALFDVS